MFFLGSYYPFGLWLLTKQPFGITLLWIELAEAVTLISCVWEIPIQSLCLKFVFCEVVCHIEM
jgi:hypothetical protein